MIHDFHYEVSENTSDVVYKIVTLYVLCIQTLESIQEIIQENTWLRTTPRITYLCLAYFISPRDAMEALSWMLEAPALPPSDLAWD